MEWFFNRTATWNVNFDLSKLFLLLIFVLINYRYITTILFKNKRVVPPLPPGPSPTLPIFGCVLEVLRKKPAYRWIHHIMEELNTDIACFCLRNSHTIVVNSPEIAREFLKKHDAVFASRPETMVTSIISSGYLTTALGPGGEQWKKMRRILVSQVLSQSKMRWLLDMRNLEADNLVRLLYNQCSMNLEGEVVNVRTLAQHYPANAMRRMMFSRRYFGKGREDGGPGFEEEEHVSSLFLMLLHIYAFSISDYFPWSRRLDLDGHRKKVSDAVKVVEKYHDPIVNERIQQWREGKRTQPEDLLDVLISLKDSYGNPLLSKDEIRAQVMEIFLATVDNPYNASEWALSEMINQPNLIEKAVEELDRVVGKDRLLQESDIPQLPYVVACAREALRLHPVAPFNLPHVSAVDCTVAGYFIPKGSTVLLSRLGLGRNPAVWDDPLQFDPERHLLEGHMDMGETELRFISFSRGRRGCVGAGLGSNLTVMLLGRLLQGFTWNIPEGVDKIDLTEADSLLRATPLFAHAKPRLNASVYSSLL